MQTNKYYKEIVEKNSPKTDTTRKTLLSFLGGGFVCTVGELFSSLYIYLGVNKDDAYLLTTLTFIFIGSTLTALGIFDCITNYIYSGTLVPVTGFSNSITSAAMDGACDGHTVGVGAKIFSVCGPVILFGTISGVLYGLVYFLYTLF